MVWTQILNSFSNTERFIARWIWRKITVLSTPHSKLLGIFTIFSFIFDSIFIVLISGCNFILECRSKPQYFYIANVVNSYVVGLSLGLYWILYFSKKLMINLDFSTLDEKRRWNSLFDYIVDISLDVLIFIYYYNYKTKLSVFFSCTFSLSYFGSVELIINK